MHAISLYLSMQDHASELIAGQCHGGGLQLLGNLYLTEQTWSCQRIYNEGAT